MTTETIEVLTIWDKCFNYLRDEIPQQKFNTWLRPLHAEMNKNTLTLLAPNQFVLDWVNEHFLAKITDTLRELCEGEPPIVKLRIGTKKQEDDEGRNGGSISNISVRHDAPTHTVSRSSHTHASFTPHQSNLNPLFRFDR